MQYETMLFWWHAAILNRRRFEALIRVFGDLDGARSEFSASMLQELGVRGDAARRALERVRAFDADKAMDDMERCDVQLLCMHDEGYPALLREIGDPPVFLSYKGDISVLDKPALGIVGTRRMSMYGRRVVEMFVPPIARSDVVTVSGLALGVDTAVAAGTLEAQGTTVAVLGHGLGSVYPKGNEALARRIVEEGGALVSEFPLFQKPEFYTFPARNRIIAGLTLGTLVIEAPEDSGSIITAELALEYGRDVFAVPGQIFDDHFAGCHRLIASGQARLAPNPREVLREIGIIVPDTEHKHVFIPASADEDAVYRALHGMPQSLDDLVERVGLDAARIGTALTMMELAGAVRNAGGGLWVRR